MIPAIQEIGFGPGTDKAYATLHQATVSFAEMGERTISTQVRIDGDVVPDFDGWEVSFKGERFILNTKDPQAVKDNSTRNSLVDLTFVSWVVNELKRYFFFEPTSIDAGTAIADKYKASVNVPVEDFAVLFNKVLDYYFDGQVVFSLYMSGQGQYSTDRALVEIDYTYIWDVLVKFFEIYGVRWRIEHDSTNDVYTIKAGWPTTDIDINDHDFEYGYNGGLLRFERQVQDVDIHNILLGRGGEKNIPYRYFKRIDPQNPDWAADPDAIPELSNIYFDRLRDINFRWYVRGWMQNPNHDTSWEDGGYVYPTYTIASDSPYYFAYQKGLTDEKFNPVEYVKDDESIADYGEHWGALDDNDDIFPTIQGVTRAPLGRIDETVAVSEIVTDDIEAMAENAAIEKSINRLTISLDGETETVFDRLSEEFTIPSGSTGNVTYVPVGTDEVNPGLVRFDTENSTVVAVADGTEYPIDALPAGTYRLKLHMVIARSGQATSATGTFGIENIVLTTSSMDTDAWKPTFDIWVKNIWGTTKGQDENDIQYAERVWLPILGDRTGNEAKIVFSSGFMSVSEDYEFTIVSYPVYDTSKSINGVPSEWRITLRKSDAEFDATGLYIPNASTGGQPVAGDKFFFIGIDMPFRYVDLAEEDLNTNKEAQLDTEATISPTWIMNLDKVRVHTLEDQEYGQTLADRLAAGGKVWIKDKRFTPGQRLQLYVQSITYTWNEPSDDSPYIVPDIEVVLSDKVVAVDSVVQRIQNDVSSIKNQYARISDVEAVVRSVAEPIFLKKTGESDSSDSPTQFSSKVTSKGFRQGAIGGTGWGIYRDNTSAFAADENEQAVQTRGTRSLRALRANAAEQEEEADAVIEADRIVVRKELQVNSLVINQIAYVGGKEIISAAKIEVTKVIETNDGYICYFDQRRNSVANNFAVNDIAFGQVFNPDNTEQRYYKMVVTATDVDCITLSKSPKDGSGAPKVGDIIVQYGNTTNTDRQYVIVRDVIGGGYERMLSGLNSVSATGKEYYFAGRQNNSGARWFVGDALGDYAEYEDGVLTIKANVIFKAGQEIPGVSDLQYLKTALPLDQDSTLVSGGLILSKTIALTDANGDIKAGINGLPTLSPIAAWYGGPMADKEATPTPASYAQSLFRFDGSGYLAGGNIGWENDGDGHIPGISWETTGGVTSVTIGANVKLEQTGGTDSSVTDLVSAVQSFPSTYLTIANAALLYHPLGGSTTLNTFKIGGATLTWHPESSAGAGDAYLEINSAIITGGDQIVVDGTPGQGGGGGGAGYLYELNDVADALRAPSTGTMIFWNGSSWVGNTLPSGFGAGYVPQWDGSKWTAVAASSIGGVTSVVGQTGAVTAAQISSALNLGAAATYGIGSVASGNTGLVTGGAVWSAIDALPEPMVFKGSLGTGGTITSLPVNGTAQVGDTYKVITAGTYAGQTAKVGDTFICQTKTASANTWVLIPSGDEPEGTVTSVGLSLPVGLVLDTVNGSASPITDSGTFVLTFQSGYAIPTTEDVAKGVAARGYFNSSGVLTYDHGGTGRSSAWTANGVIYASSTSALGQVTNVSGNSQKKFLVQTTNGSGVAQAPAWGSLAFSDLPTLYWANVAISNSSSTTTEPTFASVRIGDAEITWVEGVGGADGYLQISTALVTQGDQIVVSGTPGGGGGGGGASYLYELNDVSINAASSGQALIYRNGSWVNETLPEGAIYTAGYAIAIAQNAISVAHTNEDTDPISFDPDTHTGLDASNLVEWGTSAHANCAKLTVGVGSDSPVSKDLVLASGYDYLLGLINSQVSGVSSVAGKTGAVTLEIADVTGLQTALNGKQAAGSYVHPTDYASANSAGVIKVGTGLSINSSGVLSATASIYTAGSGISISSGTISNTGVLSIGSKTGAITLGSNLSISSSGVLSATDTTYGYASASAAGIIKIGTGLTIDSSGVVSVTGQTQGTVTRVDVGSTQYSPSSAGVVSLPAYPTVPTNVSAFTNDAGYITSYTNTWRNVYTGGTSRVGTGTDTKAINFAAGTGISISYKAAGTGSGQSGSANYFNVEIGVTANTYQPLDADLTAIAGLSGTSGFLKKTASNTWSLDTNTYLTGNQTITLSGDVSGSGATSITTTIGEGKVTNAMLAGSIENSKLNTIGVSKGGTGLTTWTGAYRLIYSTAATTLTTLAPNSTTTRKFLRQVGANNAATAPAWDTVTKTDVGLGNVPNWVYTITDSSAQNFTN